MATIPSRKSLDPSDKRRRNRIGIVVFSLISLILIGELLVGIVIPMVKGFISTRVTSDRYLVLTLPDSMRADYIAMDQQGNLWFADRTINKVGKITLDGKQVTEYTLPNAYTSSDDPAKTDGNLWFFITIGPDGNPWFSVNGPKGYSFAKITQTGQVTEYPLPSKATAIGGITNGPDGNLWFTASGPTGHKVGKITPTGHITEYPIHSKISEIGSIARGPDGNLWFTESIAQIGRITPSGVITEFAIEKQSNPEIIPGTISSGPDGNVWFTYGENIVKVGKITPDGKVIAWYTLPREASNPGNLMTGPDGNLWFTEGGPNGSYLGRITPTGVITEFHEGYGDFGYTSIAAFGNDLWFAIDFYSPPGKIGRMPIK
jgi:streptogramin lyase